MQKLIWIGGVANVHFPPIADIRRPFNTGGMRTTVPPAFSMTFNGPEGPYTIHFRPTDEWDGVIDVSVAGLTMRWDVVNADQEDDGGVVIGGMTSGSESVWNEQFWFDLRLNDTPPVIQYWGTA